jgi:hypothetical protein
MDPWFEHPDVWPDLHNRLIVAIADALAAELTPRYFIGVETRTTILTALSFDQIYRPDVTILAAERLAQAQRESRSAAVLEPTGVDCEEFDYKARDEVDENYLLIQRLPDRRTVTVLEILSPSIKKTVEGRAEYLRKRDDFICSCVHFIEIDLLRGGDPMFASEAPRLSDYRVMIVRNPRRTRAVLYRFGVRAAIPNIPIPLLSDDPEPSLALNQLAHALFDRARYDLIVDYSQPPLPPLPSDNKKWADAIVRARNETTQNSL